MSLVHKEIPGTVYEKFYKCDRDGCTESEMQCDPYTIQGGYGSTVMDCDQRHFCSLKCLREWVNTGEFKDVQE